MSDRGARGRNRDRGSFTATGGHGKSQYYKARANRDTNYVGAASGSGPDEKRTIILAKPERDREFPTLQQSHHREQHAKLESRKSVDHDDPLESKVKDEKRPFDVLLAGKKTVSHTGSTASGASVAALDGSSGIAARSAASSSLPVMLRSKKILDELQFCDYLSDYLGDGTEFLVIGIVGPQGSGKSTFMNHLAKELMIDADAVQPDIFRRQNFEKQMMAEHCTNGLLAWVSSQNRVILIDSQPVNSASILDRTIQTEKYASEYNTAENTVIIQSHQIAGFLMNVCHLLIVMQDSFLDLNLMKFLRVAEMLKPSSVTSSGDEVTHYFPECVLVVNKAHVEDFSDSSLRQKKELVGRVFSGSRLQTATSLGLSLSDLMMCPRRGFGRDDDPWGNVNVFLLPDLECDATTSSASLCCNLTYDGLMDVFRRKVLSVQPRPLSTLSKLTEKAWLSYCQKSWDTLRSCPFYLEFSRLLP